MKTNEENPYEGFMEKYPILFQNKDKSMMETCMCWGIECPPGWLTILTELCDKLEFLNEHLAKRFEFQIVADQVKEKYGYLHFYYSIRPFDVEIEERENKYRMIDGIVHDLIAHAENQTMNICSVCGKDIYGDDIITSTGWIRFYCRKCAKENNV